MALPNRSNRQCEVCGANKDPGCRCGRYSTIVIGSGGVFGGPYKAPSSKTISAIKSFRMAMSPKSKKHEVGDRIINNGTLSAGHSSNPNGGKYGVVVGVMAGPTEPHYEIMYDDGGTGSGEYRYYDAVNSAKAPPLNDKQVMAVAMHFMSKSLSKMYPNGSAPTISGITLDNMATHAFKVGDRVKVKGDNFSGEEDLGKKKGTVIVVGEHGPNDIGVSFDNYSDGHSLNGKIKDDSGFFGDANELELFVVPKIVFNEAALDPLILEESVKKEIIAVLKQHDNADKLFTDWGLAETIEYGRGMSMMFWGGPGTGKTWGAHCIAKALGTTLLSISAAEIQSSEPGATERNLKEAFKAAKEEGKVLFIDECDSIITTRADLGMVLAAQVNCLLTEIEKFEGVCILATNRVETMDEALERRLALIVEFPFPKYAQRVKIWEKLLPKKLPLAPGITPETLGQPKFSGGLIKNIILQAARLAVAEGKEVVEQADFDKAVERLNKSKGIMGKMERSRTGRPRQDVGVGVNNNPQIDTKVDLDTFLSTEEDTDKK